MMTKKESTSTDTSTVTFNANFVCVDAGDSGYLAVGNEAEAEVASVPKVNASKPAKLFAAENGVDIGALAGKGTGKGGRITKKDVQAFIDEEPMGFDQ